MRLTQLIAIGAVSAALLTGCAAGGGSDSAAPGAVYSDEGGGYGGEMAVQDSTAAGDRAAADGSTDADQSVPASGDYLVREASIGVKVDSIEDAAQQVREIATEAGGSVISEQFGDSGYYPMETDITRFGTMTVSVPSAELDATMERLADLGEVRTRSSNAYDVQDEYVDVEARAATLEASIERMRALMDRTEDIKQIVELETALSARQADLDSLRARLNSLDQRIAMSPVQVSLTTTDDLGEPEGGILGALRDAWNAFTASAALLITAVGALLPWLAVGAIAAWVLVVVLRRWERRRKARAANTAAPADTAAPMAVPDRSDPDASPASAHPSSPSSESAQSSAPETHGDTEPPRSTD
jgi:hypothetical protein